MRVLLTTPLVHKADWPAPPVNLAYIAGVLVNNGHEVQILDAYLEGTQRDELTESIQAFQPKVVGITCNVEDRFEAFQTATFMKLAFPDLMIVLGGPFASVCHREILRAVRSIDVVVRSEGEYAMLDILERMEVQDTLDGVLGATFRKGTEIIANADRPFIKELDELPLPAYSLLKTYPNYLRYVLGQEGKAEEFEDHSMLFVFGRGCPYDCVFCSSKELWKRTYRMPSAEKAIEHVKYFTDKGVNTFIFCDDHLLLNKRWFYEFAGLIEGNNLNITFECQARVDSIDEPIARRLKDIGCKSIYMGTETGSDKILRIMNKNITTVQSENAIQILSKYGIFVRAPFLIGFPDENLEDITQSLDCFRRWECKFGVRRWWPLGLIIFPGTRLETIAAARGQLKGFSWVESYYCKDNWLFGRSPLTPLYQEIPTKNLVQQLLRAIIKTRDKVFFLDLLYDYAVMLFRKTKRGKAYRNSFYFWTLMRLCFKGSPWDKLFFLRMCCIFTGRGVRKIFKRLFYYSN